MTTLTRAELSRLFPGNPKAVLAFEGQQRDLASATSSIAGNADATTALQDATVITLSPNAALTNERVLYLGDGISATDGGDRITISMTYPVILNGSYRCTFNLLADTNLDLPSQGAVLVDDGSGPYADDAAAAADGVPIRGLYFKSDGTVAWRVS